jgi:ribosomal protein L7/L12
VPTDRWVDLARERAGRGESAETVADALLGAGADTIRTIHAVRVAFGVPLHTAKEIVHPRIPANPWVGVAVERAAVGESAETVAAAVLAAGADPIRSIDAVRVAFGVRLATAKGLVHRRLPQQQQAAAEALWDALEETVPLLEIDSHETDPTEPPT